MDTLPQRRLMAEETSLLVIKRLALQVMCAQVLITSSLVATTIMVLMAVSVLVITMPLQAFTLQFPEARTTKQQAVTLLSPAVTTTSPRAKIPHAQVAVTIGRQTPTPLLLEAIAALHQVNTAR